MQFSTKERIWAIAIAGLFVFGSGAQADLINVPGDQPTIQAAIDVAFTGDEIVVAPGTYFETINFLGKAITLRSSEGPEVTTIDADGTGTVVTCTSAEGPGTVLQGFTIASGFVLDGNGGGMLNLNSSPTVIHCTFTGNFSGLDGGGMYNAGGSPTVSDCTFTGNVVFSNGGGMYNEDSSPTVTNCTFNRNAATNFGGGGGMYSSGGSPTVTNCTFSANNAHLGGGMYNKSSNPTATNCTFTANSAGNGGGIFHNSSNTMVTNCILWNDSPNEISGIATLVTYTDIDGGNPGEGNIDADPVFVDPDGPDDDPDTFDDNDYRLAAGSVCIDAGASTAVPLFEDLARNVRGVDDPATIDTGIPAFGLTVDMGAYEFQVDQCLADLNGDGTIGPFDLATLLAAWGLCK